MKISDIKIFQYKLNPLCSRSEPLCISLFIFPESNREICPFAGGGGSAFPSGPTKGNRLLNAPFNVKIVVYIKESAGNQIFKKINKIKLRTNYFIKV